MKKIRRILSEILSVSLNTSQINHLGREVDSKFSVAEVSGFGEKIVIPRKVAADCIINFFSTEERLLEFISYMISREGFGASGGVVNLRGIDQLLTALRENNWIFNSEERSFYRDQRHKRTADWGFMKEGEEYFHSFCSIDIVSSSEFIKNNVKEDIELTMGRLRSNIYEKVEQMNGRIWTWHGDGGMAVFHGNKAVDRAVLAMIRILSFLPIFNIAQSELRPETDIKIRVGIHFGSAVYMHDITKIISPDLKLAIDIENKSAKPNTIAISEVIYESLPLEMRSAFEHKENYNSMKIFNYRP